jgi:hypothetical protein
MKLLKIEVGEGKTVAEFLNPKNLKDREAKNSDYLTIDQITKEDVFDMIDYLLDNDVEFDTYENGKISSQVQDTIYKSLYESFTSAQNSKNDIKNEIDLKFSEAEKKYLN